MFSAKSASKSRSIKGFVVPSCRVYDGNGALGSTVVFLMAGKSVPGLAELGALTRAAGFVLLGRGEAEVL